MRDTLDHDQLFLSREQLGLDPALYRGLIEIAERLDGGRYRYVSVAEWRGLSDSVRRGDADEAAVRGDFFNMNYWTARPARGETSSARHGCGSVCCIGGWLQTRIGKGRLNALHGACEADVAEKLDVLFNPPIDKWVWDAITPTQAAHQVRFYLRTGNVDWSESLRPDQARRPKSWARPPGPRHSRTQTRAALTNG